ncbi:MAG: ATP-binding protein [Vicinamibacterales bacterium]|nr:ATP-binding protein [Vicinamibacterales bacterium]
MPIDEQVRLAALRKYRLLDTDPEQAFDDLALLASEICGTPIALITLVDEDRQWFKAHIGTSLRETHRSISFCAHAIAQPGLFIVPDATKDDRFRENPLVMQEPRIRFYAGAPLVTPEGHALGTLCVVDRVPRTLTERQRQALDVLRRQVEAQLELRRNLHELERALAARDEAEAEQAALVLELREGLAKVDKLTGLMPYCSTCALDIVVPADPMATIAVGEGVRQVLEGKGWSEEEVAGVELALQEALANAVRHGCKGDPTKQIRCLLTIDASGDVVIAVRDPGVGFDPKAVPSPLQGENLLKPSGRGVFLINQLMDEVRFADSGREVQMRKRRGLAP